MPSPGTRSGLFYVTGVAGFGQRTANKLETGPQNSNTGMRPLVKHTVCSNQFCELSRKHRFLVALYLTIPEQLCSVMMS